MEKFYLDQYIEDKRGRDGASSYDFKSLCKAVYREFQLEWEEKDRDIRQMLMVQKKAIIGYEKEVEYFKGKIRKYIKEKRGEHTDYPKWYESLEAGIYHENWGMAGIAQWFSEGYSQSSSCKVIGDRIYFQEGGEMVLKEQTISRDRRNQLVRALLLLTPQERMDRDFHEVYMLDGTRITIYRGEAVKENQDVMVFRRYIIPEYTFEEQYRRGTIPEEAVALFKDMVKLGYSVAITGAMKTGKTSFLATYQSYEDRNLEGVMLETDPEISLHRLMPGAPIVQILAKEESLKNVVKHLLRSDADYLIMAEARDGLALDTVLRMASKGTRRMKITFHERNPMNFPYDVAAEIVSALGGDMEVLALKAAESFDYILHFVQLKDKRQKRLKGIYSMCVRREKGRVDIRPICLYQPDSDSWKWDYVMDMEKEIMGKEEDEEAFYRFQHRLRDLSVKYPVKEAGVQ